MKTKVLIATIALVAPAAMLLPSHAAPRAPRPDRPLQAPGSRGPREEIQTDRTLPAAGITSLQAHVKVGTVRIRTDSPDGIRIHAVRTIEGGSPEERRRLRENTRLEIGRKGGAAVIEDIVPENDHVRNTNHASSRLVLEIRMPARLDVEAAAGVGDVEVGGQTGNLVVKSGVGDIRLNSLICSGRSLDAHAGVGDVVLAVRGLPSQRMKVNVGVGDVRVNLPAGAKARVNAVAKVGDARAVADLRSLGRHEKGMIGSTLSGDLNGGGTEVGVQVGVGDIQVR